MTREAELNALPFVDASDLPTARHLADLSLLMADLGYVAACCDRLIARGDSDDGVVQRALWFSAVVAYARCFGTGVRHGLATEVLDELDLEGAREFHQTLMDFRNKHVAHSVNAFEEATVGVLLSDNKAEIAGVAALNFTLVGRVDDEVRDFGRLTAALLSFVSAEAQVARDTLVEEARDLGASAFAGRPTMQLVAPHPDDAGARRAKTTRGYDPFGET